MDKDHQEKKGREDHQVYKDWTVHLGLEAHQEQKAILGHGAILDL